MTAGQFSMRNMNRYWYLAAASAVLLLTGCAAHYRFAEGVGPGD